MIDLREDGLAQLQFANQLGSQIGGTIAGIYNIKQKKLQQLKEEETSKAVVNIMTNPYLTSAQALEKYKGIKGAVDVKLSEIDKMMIQQAEYIRQQNAAIAPQVKSQMFDAARGMDFNGLTPDMMAQERQAGNAANAYGQLDRATGFSVPELGQMAQPTGQPLDGRMNDTFGRPLQGDTSDTFDRIKNTVNASAAQARYDLLNQPEEKYGTKPWWMHPDYKDTPEGIAAMQAATRIPGTGARTAGTTSKGGTTVNGVTTPEVKPLTTSEQNAYNKQLTEMEALMNRAETPEDVEYYRQQMNDVYGKLGLQPKSSQFTEPQAADLFKKIIVGDGDKAKGIGKGWGRATEGETMAAMNKIVAQLMAKGLTRQQANEFAVKQYDAMIEDDNNLIGESRLPKGKTGKDFIRQTDNTIYSGATQNNTQDIVGNEDLEAIRWAKANPNDPRAIQILQVNGIR